MGHDQPAQGRARRPARRPSEDRMRRVGDGGLDVVGEAAGRRTGAGSRAAAPRRRARRGRGRSPRGRAGRSGRSGRRRACATGAGPAARSRPGRARRAGRTAASRRADGMTSVSPRGVARSPGAARRIAGVVGRRNAGWSAGVREDRPRNVAPARSNGRNGSPALRQARRGGRGRSGAGGRRATPGRGRAARPRRRRPGRPPLGHRGRPRPCRCPSRARNTGESVGRVIASRSSSTWPGLAWTSSGDARLAEEHVDVPEAPGRGHDDPPSCTPSVT